MEKIVLTSDDGEKLELYPLESTRLGGVDYLLVSDVQTGDGECYTLKDISAPESDEAVYEIVEDDRELDNLLDIFSELVEDVDFSF